MFLRLSGVSKKFEHIGEVKKECKITVYSLFVKGPQCVRIMKNIVVENLVIHFVQANSF